MQAVVSFCAGQSRQWGGQALCERGSCLGDSTVVVDGDVVTGPCAEEDHRNSAGVARQEVVDPFGLVLAVGHEEKASRMCDAAVLADSQFCFEVSERCVEVAGDEQPGGGLVEKLILV